MFPDYATHSLDAEIAALSEAFSLEDDFITYPVDGIQSHGALAQPDSGGAGKAFVTPDLPSSALLEDDGELLSIDTLLTGLQPSEPTDGPADGYIDWLRHQGQVETDLAAVALQDVSPSQRLHADDESALMALRLQADIL